MVHLFPSLLDRPNHILSPDCPCKPWYPGDGPRDEQSVLHRRQNLCDHPLARRRYSTLEYGGAECLDCGKRFHSPGQR